MTKTEKKRLAQDLIMEQIAKIGYGSDYENYKDRIGDDEEATKILFEQMERVAKLLGFKGAWFY